MQTAGRTFRALTWLFAAALLGSCDRGATRPRPSAPPPESAEASRTRPADDRAVRIVRTDNPRRRPPSRVPVEPVVEVTEEPPLEPEEDAPPDDPNAVYSADGEIAINELEYDPPSGDPRDTWIELFNRGAAGVDLEGWRLDGDVQFTFPAGARLPAGGFLVIGADAAHLRSARGVAKAIGNWQGQLGDDSGTVRLVKESGDDVETVTYSSSNPYPIAAAGLGRSLERRNPAASAAFAGNWGVSTGARSGWKRVRVTGVATSNRLYVYLLGAGTAWVDDLRVSRGGGGAARSGSSLEESRGLWSFTGSHARSRLSPTNARSGKLSLQVIGVAAGRSSGDSANLTSPEIEAGEAYTLECRVLFGSPAVPLVLRLSNSSPASGGIYVEATPGGGSTSTPGRRNSLYAVNVPPFVYPATHGPARPSPGDAVTVRATVYGPDSVGVTLHYDDGRGEKTQSMRPLADEPSVALSGSPSKPRVFAATLGPFSTAALVKYSVTAKTDDAGASARFPFDDNPTSALGFFVESSQPSPLPVYHLFVSNQSLQTLNRNPQSDVYQPATFVYDGQVFCDAGVRYRGQTSRRYPKRHWKIKLNKDHPFPGPGGASVGSINLKCAYVDKAYMREKLAFDLIRDQGQAYCENRFVRVTMNGQFFGLFLEMENPSKEYLARNGLAEGWLWKAYDAGHSEGLSRGSRRSRLGRLVGSDPLARSTSFRGLGRFELKAGDEATGRKLLDEFLRNMNSLRGKQLEKYIRDHMDVDAFVDFLVAQQLIHNADHPGKNYLVYADAEGRFTFHSWDLDLTHGRNYECGPGILNDTNRYDLWDRDFGDDKLLFGTLAHPKCDGFWNAVINAFLGRAKAFRPIYYERLAECLRHYYHPDVLLPKARRLRDLIESDATRDRARWGAYGNQRPFAYQYERIEEWARQRYAHLEAKLEALGYEVGKPLNAHFEAAVATGKAPVKVRFENLSVGRIKKYEWDFGDGGKGKTRRPIHTYTQPGRYDVTLTVSGSDGEHRAVRKGCVVVTGE